jgi:hypothetical protein
MVARLYYPQCRAILNVVFDGFGVDAADSAPQTIAVIPRSCTIHRNSYRQADSWEITFDGRDMPIDPSLVRACFAEVYLYAASNPLEQDRLIDRQFPPAGITARGQTGGDEYLRFTGGNRPMVAGIADDLTVELSGDGRWLTIAGQDMTALLAAKQWPPTDSGRARRIPTGTRLDVWLGDILREADQLRRLRAVVDLDASELPIVGKDEVDSSRRGIPIEQDTSYWDVIYKTVTRYGFIVYVRGLDVVIGRPKNLPALDDPSIRQLAWGKNLEHVTLTRHLGKEKAPRIVVRGYDVKDRKVVTAEFPSGALKKSAADFKASFADKTSTTERLRAPVQTKKSKAKVKSETLRLDDNFVIIPAFGVSDRVVLRRMAENLHHLLGEGERRIVAVTRDLADMRGDGMMNLAAGDAVMVEWLDFKREMIVSEATSREQKVAHLISRGFQPAVAEVIARHYQLLVGIKRPMRVREATYSYDVDTGVQIELELVDFVVVNNERDADTKVPRETKRAERTKAKPAATGKGNDAFLDALAKGKRGAR